VATQLQSVLRKSNLVARIGGDEFIVACPGLRNTGEMLTIGGALSESVVPPLR
jgi:GGDEF domain-containing protein